MHSSWEEILWRKKTSKEKTESAKGNLAKGDKEHLNSWNVYQILFTFFYDGNRRKVFWYNVSAIVFWVSSVSCFNLQKLKDDFYIDFFLPNLFKLSVWSHGRNLAFIMVIKPF